MSASNRSKLPVSGMVAIGAIIAVAVCCILGVVLFWPGGEETPVAENPPVETEMVEPQFTQEPVIEDTPAVAETEALLETQTPLETEAPAATQPQVAPQPVRGDLYQHPKEGFSVQRYGDQIDEGDNYVTFWDNTNTIDVTMFDLEGALNENSLESLARDVLKSVLIETNWATSVRLTADPPEQINDGYVVYFTFKGGQNGQKEGSLFLRQDSSKLVAMTLLTSDLNANLDVWSQEVTSYAPAGGQAAAQEPVKPAAPAQPQNQKLVASGFDVNTDGFSFPNYGNERGMSSLTPTEMQRMFGDKVCASLQGDQCTLKPSARSWMNEANAAMSGGHCEGMAVLSQLFYYGQEDPKQFGDNRTYDLSIRNKDLQREIAYWWVTQSTRPGGTRKVNASPRAVVETLIDSFGKGKNADEWWVVGIYQRDGGGGHAITPIGVESMGGDKYDILVYDNNWPGEERRINVDVRRNTWYYLAATNPNQREAVYEGDADTQTLEIVAISPRLQQQACTFCSGRGAVAEAPGTRSLAQQQYYEIYLDGKTDLLITDEQGRQIGYSDGKLVNDIPEAEMDTWRYGMDVWDVAYEPIYKMPVGSTFGISVIGANLTEPSTATVTIIGPGFYMEISDIWLEPGEVDALGVANDGKFFGLSYLSTYTETPLISMGIEQEDVSYAFMAQATDLPGDEDTINVGIDLEAGQFVLNSSENKQKGVYDVYVLRLTPDGEEAFGTSGLTLNPGNTIYLDYLTWLTNGQSMTAQLDTNDDGTPDETIELPDTSDEFIWE